MEYVYAAMLLHQIGKEINEENLKKILKAAGAKTDDSRVKTLVAALQDVDIDDAVKAAPVAEAAPAPETKSEEKEEKKEEKEEEVSEEEAAAGLGALFG